MLKFSTAIHKMRTIPNETLSCELGESRENIALIGNSHLCSKAAS